VIAMHKTEVDPDLERQLEAAGDDEPVEAVLLLKDDAGHKPPPNVDALLKRARVRDADVEMNYMPLLGALIVRASSRVVRILISQPEVELASANRSEGDAAL
jgi:hypothetical protein